MQSQIGRKAHCCYDKSDFVGLDNDSAKHKGQIKKYPKKMTLKKRRSPPDSHSANVNPLQIISCKIRAIYLFIQIATVSLEKCTLLIICTSGRHLKHEFSLKRLTLCPTSYCILGVS